MKKETVEQKMLRLRMRVALCRMDVGEAIRRQRHAELALKVYKRSLRAPRRKP